MPLPTNPPMGFQPMNFGGQNFTPQTYAQHRQWNAAQAAPMMMAQGPGLRHGSGAGNERGSRGRSLGPRRERSNSPGRHGGEGGGSRVPVSSHGRSTSQRQMGPQETLDWDEIFDNIESRTSALENNSRLHGQKIAEVQASVNHFVARLESTIEDIENYKEYNQQRFAKIETVSESQFAKLHEDIGNIQVNLQVVGGNFATAENRFQGIEATLNALTEFASNMSQGRFQVPRRPPETFNMSPDGSPAAQNVPPPPGMQHPPNSHHPTADHQAGHEAFPRVPPSFQQYHEGAHPAAGAFGKDERAPEQPAAGPPADVSSPSDGDQTVGTPARPTTGLRGGIPANQYSPPGCYAQAGYNNQGPHAQQGYFNPGMNAPPNQYCPPGIYNIHSANLPHATVNGIASWQICYKDNKDLFKFNPTSSNYKEWAEAIFYHLARTNRGWINLLQWIQKMEKPVTYSYLSTESIGGVNAWDIACTFETWIVGWLSVGLKGRKLGLCGNEQGNGLELWRQLFRDHAGTGDMIEESGRKALQNFPQCNDKNQLAAHLDARSQLVSEYGK